MWIKSLWWKEYEQAKWLVWLLPVVHFCTLGMMRLDKWFLDDDFIIQQAAAQVLDTASAYAGGSLENTSRTLLAILLAVLAGMLMGAERRNGVQEMAFALPYSRQQLFWTKWMFGAALIVGSVLVNSIIDMTLILNSPVSGFFNFHYHLFQFSYSIFTLLAVYSTVLFIGALSGSMASQLIFSAILGALPVGFSVLIQQFLDVHDLDQWNSSYYGFQPFDTWMQNISLMKYLFMDLEANQGYPILVPALYLTIATIGGCLAYERNRVENNGKLMLFSIGETVLKIGFVICASLLGAAFLSSIFQNELIFYYGGLLVSLALSTWLIRRLTRIRLKI